MTAGDALALTVNKDKACENIKVGKIEDFSFMLYRKRGGRGEGRNKLFIKSLYKIKDQGMNTIPKAKK